MITKSAKSVNTVYCGTVLWFSDIKGYGFIESPSIGRNIFVHYSRINTDEKYKTLAKGQIVDFEVVETVKGLMAVNVKQKKVINIETK